MFSDSFQMWERSQLSFQLVWVLAITLWVPKPVFEPVTPGGCETIPGPRAQYLDVRPCLPHRLCLFERPAYSFIGIEELVGDEVELAFKGFVIFPVGAAPIVELLKMFRLPIRCAAGQRELIEQTFGLFFGPILVEKNHLIR